MKHKKEWLLANLLSLLVLVVVLVLGWRDAAVFGLAVLLMMDAIILIREGVGRHEDDTEA